MILPADLLDLAEEWADAETEAAWRSSVSRAYYAVFHEARGLMRQLGFEVPRGEVAHAYLSLRLSNCGIPTIEQAGHQLNSLRGDRNRADYDIDRTLKQSNARHQVATARVTFQTFVETSQLPDATGLIDSIRRYETDVLRDTSWHRP